MPTKIDQVALKGRGIEGERRAKEKNREADATSCIEEAPDNKVYCSAKMLCQQSICIDEWREVGEERKELRGKRQEEGELNT